MVQSESQWHYLKITSPLLACPGHMTESSTLSLCVKLIFSIQGSVNVPDVTERQNCSIPFPGLTVPVPT